MAFFDVVYLDPPWQYKNKKTGGSHTSGAAQKYATMSLDELKVMPVRDIANPKGSMCFLWATVPFGPDPYTLMDALGYKFKTKWFWHKVGQKGTGYWTRGEVEELLIGVRGKVPAWRSSINNWIEEPPDDFADTLTTKPEGHSQKPEGAIRRIEELTLGAGRRCELFATKHSEVVAQSPLRRGDVTPWECYGLDLGHDFRNPRFWTPLIESCRAK